MATQYPSEREDWEFTSGILQDKIKELESKNRELNIALMRKSAEASEASEELKRCKLEWEVVADQKGHNMCWKTIATALKRTIGYTGVYPDPDKVSGEQFARGCVDYHGDLFPDCGVKLTVVKSDQK